MKPRGLTMNHRGRLIRKAFEAFLDAKAYYKECYRLYDAIQYKRNNVKGVNYEPKVPGTGSGETKALLYDREMQTVSAELYRLQLYLDWINTLLDEFDTDDEAFIRERYIEGMQLETIAEAHGLTREGVKYKYEQIFRNL